VAFRLRGVPNVPQLRRTARRNGTEAVPYRLQMNPRITKSHSLPLRPHLHFLFFGDLDVNNIGMAADGAILDVFLARSRGQVERGDDLMPHESQT
jgi:hypothetical protein